MSNRKKLKGKPPKSRRHFITMDDFSNGAPHELMGEFVEEKNIDFPHRCIPECEGMADNPEVYYTEPDLSQCRSERMAYPCCFICGDADTTNQEKHWLEKHPKIMGDSITMKVMGYTDDQIDETILSQRYLDGKLEGFKGEPIEHDFKTVVMMRMMRSNMFESE